MLPILPQELFTAFRLFNFSVKKWGKLHIFLRESFAMFGFRNFPVKKRGRCCPFFCENFLQSFDL